MNKDDEKEGKPDDEGAREPQEAEAPPGDWFTIREAAVFLGVSEPTIFRWMKDGLLSFYKVGGGTRFSRRELAAMVEKNTSRREAEAAALRCACCGHSVLVEGSLQGTGRLYFRPSSSRFLVLAEAMVPTRARVCAACGHVHLVADTSKLDRLRPKAGWKKP